MPVNQIEKTESPVTGGLSVRAQGNPVGQAVQGFGDSIQRTAQVGTQIAIQKQQQADRLKMLDDVTHANKVFSDEKLLVAKYLEDPKVSHAENVSDLVKTF